MTNEELLVLVKEFAGINDDTQDAQINIYIRRVTRRVLNYCNLLEIPVELGEIVAEMVVDMLKSGGSTIIEGSGSIKRVSRGDTTVEYDVGSQVVNGDSVDDVLTNYKQQLNQFRRLRVLK
ncbi:phage head-tail connector protein [Bacillus massiliigorillae]|uniref:phage head-tail connector protein n=1 Tax=Bacillus massiliigorillae TaxID=1243664 RepID=UPI0003A55EF3|nr:phage head-tail connector protein [Bacillus massiliigorillae]